MTQHKSIQSGLWAAAAGIALTVFAPLASAQPHGHEAQRGGPQAHHPAAMHGKAPAHSQAGGRHRGAGPDHNLYRGGKLPRGYRSKHYVVDDWRGHGLQRPARGQHWVQVGSDYLLVAAATGVIAQIVLH